MQPISLYIEGFNSYGAPVEVFLEPLDLAVITGANGAGKSTLVDAICWALFGRGRVDADADAVITTDGDKATVTFEFEIDGSRWRATRTKQRGKTASALLESQDEFGVWQARSTGKVRDTDDAIRALLGMSLDTFLATVVVGQGDADRFTSADPSERKQVLGEVLGLGKYTVLADRARQRAGDARARSRAVLDQVSRLDDDLLHCETVEADLAVAAGERDTAAEKAAAADQARHEADVKLSSFDATVEALGAAENRLEGLLLEVDERRRSADQQVTVAEADVDRVRRQGVSAREALDRALAARDQLDGARAKQAEVVLLLENAERAARAAVPALSAARAVTVGLRGELANMRAQRAGLLERRDGVEKAASSGAADCWVCARPLTDEHATSILASLASEMAALSAAGHTKRTEVDSAEQAERDLTAAHDRANCEVDRLRQEAQTLNMTVAQLTAEAGTVVEHQDRRSELQHAYQAANDRLAAACAAQRAATDDSVANAVRAEIGELRTRIAGRAAVEKAVVVAGQESQAARAALDQAIRRHCQLEERLGALARVADERDRLQDDVQVSLTSERSWSQLGKAFGRDGIPAMIVASAVPEMEEQANDVLDRLSDGHLSVRITTTKVTKSGASKETLDIIVVGGDGHRAYETYSGGERLRIDLALRIGLSRLLANRSGHQMRFLAIDEGWGPLDSEGVPALIECLRSLHESGEFAAVWTITHIPEVAASFPQRVEVTRGVDGHSMIDVAA